MASLSMPGTDVGLRTGTPTQTLTPTPTPTPFDSTAVSSPDLAAVAAATFAVVGAVIVLLRLRAR